jgi:hypothetical protein
MERLYPKLSSSDTLPDIGIVVTQELDEHKAGPCAVPAFFMLSTCCSMVMDNSMVQIPMTFHEILGHMQDRYRDVAGLSARLKSPRSSPCTMGENILSSGANRPTSSSL